MSSSWVPWTRLSSPTTGRTTPASCCVEARTGDHGESVRIRQQIEALEIPYAFGDDTRWRARIAAQLGQNEHAIDLLRQAFAEGRDCGTWLHADVDLEPLRAHSGFQELLKPKG